MPHAETFISVALAGFALSLSPGPSMLYVLSRTIGQGRIAGIASAIGLCIGGIFLALIAAFGLGTLVEQYPVLVRFVTIIGGCYLVYLGYQQLEALKNDAIPISINVRTNKKTGLWRIAVQAILVEALNPKTILFFVLFISPFLDPSAGDLKIQAILLGMLVPLTAIPSDLTVVFMGWQLHKVAQSHPFLRTILAWLACLILMLIGISLLSELFE